MSSVSADISLEPLRRSVARWSFSLYPDAGEGGGSFQGSVRRVPAYVARGAARDPERSAAEAGRRARATLRRYCAANRLNRLGALTYRGSGCHEPERVREHFGIFFRTLRDSTGGKPLAYAWVPEWHKSGHGLHAHFAVGRFIRRSAIDAAWGRGFVHIKLLGDLPVGSTNLSEARRAAGYLSKYVSKSFAEAGCRVMGLHRYDVAQGLQAASGDRHWLVCDGSACHRVGSVRGTAFNGMVVGVGGGLQGPPAIWAQWGR
jgi:hypothetical protein